MNSARTKEWLALVANLEHHEVFEKLVSDGELSANDQLRLSFMFALDLRNREFEYFQYKNGLLDEETWLAYRTVIEINRSAGPGRLLADARPNDMYLRMATWADEK